MKEVAEDNASVTGVSVSVCEWEEYTTVDINLYNTQPTIRWYRVYPGVKAVEAWRWTRLQSSAEFEGRVEL
jgi:hypothetical protein